MFLPISNLLVRVRVNRVGRERTGTPFPFFFLYNGNAVPVLFLYNGNVVPVLFRRGEIA